MSELSELSHMSSLKNVENSTNNFCQPVQICYREEEGKKTIAIAKLFALHENTIKEEL